MQREGLGYMVGSQLKRCRDRGDVPADDGENDTGPPAADLPAEAGEDVVEHEGKESG